MDVGIRELKAHLSEYVDRAARGEMVRVTDRGRPRAVLMPLPVTDNLERGLAEGWLVWKSRELPRDVVPQQPDPGTPTTTELIDEDRGE